MVPRGSCGTYHRCSLPQIPLPCKPPLPGTDKVSLHVRKAPTQPLPGYLVGAFRCRERPAIISTSAGTNGLLIRESETLNVVDRHVLGIKGSPGQQSPKMVPGGLFPCSIVTHPFIRVRWYTRQVRLIPSLSHRKAPQPLQIPGPFWWDTSADHSSAADTPGDLSRYTRS